MNVLSTMRVALPVSPPLPPPIPLPSGAPRLPPSLLPQPPWPSHVVIVVLVVMSSSPSSSSSSSSWARRPTCWCSSASRSSFCGTWKVARHAASVVGDARAPGSASPTSPQRTRARQAVVPRLSPRRPWERQVPHSAEPSPEAALHRSHLIDGNKRGRLRRHSRVS